MAHGVDQATGAAVTHEGVIRRTALMACLLLGVVGAGGTSAADSPKEGQAGYLAEQRSLAEQGNVWAEYKLFTAYRDGTHGAEIDLRQADRWLAEIIRGVHLVTFEPTRWGNPTW